MSLPAAFATHPPVVSRLVQKGGILRPTGRGGQESPGVGTPAGEDILPAGAGPAETLGPGPGGHLGHLQGNQGH